MREDTVIDKQPEYEKRDQLVQGLRELADLYEKNGVDKLPLPDYGVSVQLDVTKRRREPTADNPWNDVVDDMETRKAVKKAVRGMGRGKKDKVYSDYGFVVNKRITPMVLLQVKTSRDAVCRKVFTGRTIVHPASTYTSPERVEEEFEWVCDDPVFAAPTSE